MASAAAPPCPCPLCAAPRTQVFAQLSLPQWGERLYLHCQRCDLVFLHPAQRLSASAEQAHYHSHENNPADAGYRQFLSRLLTPLLSALPAPAPHVQGLDYGAGPGPTLSLMLAEAGYPTRIYDPFFAPDAQVLSAQYAFITCSEVAEHFHAPGVEFARLDALLQPGGVLGLMTGLRQPATEFARWHYVRDPTHVCFYSAQSLCWLSNHLGWQLQLIDQQVALLHKPRRTAVGADIDPVTPGPRYAPG